MGPEEENDGSKYTSSNSITVQFMIMCVKVKSLRSIEY